MIDWTIPIAGAVCVVVAFVFYYLGAVWARNTLARTAAELVAARLRYQYNIGFLAGRAYQLRREIQRERDQ